MKLMEVLKTEKLYAQGVSSVPLYLMTCSRSGFTMGSDLGYQFKFFCHTFKQGYGEMLYPVSELNRLWEIIREKIKDNPKYLFEVKVKYQEHLLPGQKLFASLLTKDLNGLTEAELLNLFKQCIEISTVTVGLGHIIEPVGFGLDEELKQRLLQHLPDKKSFNLVYANLTKPSQLSFIAEEQVDLEKLLGLDGPALEDAIQIHLKKYYWLLCNYTGPRKLTKQAILERFEAVRKPTQQGQTGNQPIEIEIDEETRHMADTLNFLAVWQDERKLNIMKAIYHLGSVIEEISRRTGIKADHIAYLSPAEALSLDKMEDLNDVHDLIKREEGVFYLQLPDGEASDVLIGRDYEEAMKLYEALNGQGSSKPGSSAIYGSVANPGTALGRVVVCTDLASIDKVQEGDVLVASMTRPEYMAAIKKAAAIVTDEGGITCHAAIVARELGIPCVIGTKVATKVFKDGDMVEVRANHGMIKKI
ncbi:MAG: PEP-utilizing enzyme [Patescibacteria group bacterium]|jgi:phosphohistidine swiveling domain-containing protein